MASIEELFADLRESYDRRHDRLVECLSLLTRMEEYSRRKEYSTVTTTEVDAMPDAQLHPVAVQEAQLHPVAVPSTQIHHDVVLPPTTMEEVLTTVPETQLHLVAVRDAQLQPVAVPDVLLHPVAVPGAQIDYGVKPLRRGATITTGCSFGKSASGYTAAAPQIHFIGDHNPELQRDCTWWQDLGVSLIAHADDTRRHWKVPWRWFDESMFDCCDYIGAWRPPWPPPAVEQPGLSNYTILVAVPGTELHLVVHDHVSDVRLGVDVELSGINTHAPANCSMQCHTGLLQQTHVKGVDHKEHTKEHAAMCACDCTTAASLQIHCIAKSMSCYHSSALRPGASAPRPCAVLLLQSCQNKELDLSFYGFTDADLDKEFFLSVWRIAAWSTASIPASAPVLRIGTSPCIGCATAYKVEVSSTISAVHIDSCSCMCTRCSMHCMVQLQVFESMENMWRKTPWSPPPLKLTD